MAAPSITAVSRVSDTSGATTTVSVALNTTGVADPLILVWPYSISGSASGTLVTFNSVSFSYVDFVNSGAAGLDQQQMWYLVGPASGAFNIVATFNTTDSALGFTYALYGGVHQTVPVGISAKNSGNPISLTFSSMTTDDIAVFHCVGPTVSSYAPGTDVSERFDQASGVFGGAFFVGDKIGTGSVNAQVTCDTAGGTGIGLVLHPAGAAAGSSLGQRRGALAPGFNTLHPGIT